MTKIKVLFLALLLVGVSAVSGFAQSTTTTTTLSAAITSPAPGVNRGSNFVITVASNSGITGTNNATNGTPASGLYIDNEYFLVRSTSGTTLVTVTGGQAGTVMATHASGAIVWIGPTGGNGPFFSGPGNGRPINGGSCNTANILWLPQINVLTGAIYDCIQSVWVAYTPVAPLSLVYPRRTITANYTATTRDQYIANTTTTAGATVAVTLPCTTAPAGKSWIVADEGGSAGTAGFGISIIGLVDTQQILTGRSAKGYTTNGTACFRTF